MGTMWWFADRDHAAELPCACCGRKEHTRLCDFPQAPGKLCNRKLCDDCAVHIGRGRDYCPEHPRNLELAL